MSSYGEVLAALDDYRADLHEEIVNELDDMGSAQPVTAFVARGAMGGQTGPFSNVHATGVGIRVRAGKVVPNEHVIKVYVFDKQNLGAATPSLMSKSYKGVDIDVEALPIQQARQPARGSASAAVTALAAIPNQARHRPIEGGLSISPLHANFVGTLGCLVKRRVGGAQQLFALSNNHVLADVNSLPTGTSIVQPGPETGPTTAADVFAQLTSFIPIAFPQPAQPPPTNLFDAAIAQVIDPALVRPGTMFGIPNYTPKLVAPVPGMAVTKSGRTTGVTAGVVIATHVNNLQINYGAPGSPLIGRFNDAVHVRSPQGSFSLPGDSGSVILESATGKGTALLFAGDRVNTFACGLAGVCRRFRVTLA